MPDKHEACPFCGERKAEAQKVEHSEFSQVVCKYCGARGPKAMTNSAAWYAWDKRTDPIAEPVQETMF